MKFGLFGINMRPCMGPEEVAAVVRAAEGGGFESIWGGEHIVLADPHAPPSPMPPLTYLGDLISTIAYASAHTRTLRFGTGIIILPLRNPVILAKQLASLDVISNGRLIFGIGIGNLEIEFNALGMPFDHKGARAEESLAAMKALWTMERPEFHGRFVSFNGVRAQPRPIQKPYPEIVLGGKTVHAFSRTARLGRGWFGFGLDLEATAQCIAGIRAACAIHNRPFEEIEISITPKAELDRGLVQRYADLGVGRLILAPRARTAEEMVRAIAQAARDFIGK